MSGEGYTPKEWLSLASFAVASVLLGVGAYQIGYNLSGGREKGGAGMSAAVSEPVSGQGLYAGNCAGCHGAKAEGGVGPTLTTAAGWTPEQFAEAVLHGKTPQRELSAVMPRFATAGLDGDAATPEQINAVHDYLKTLK